MKECMWNGTIYVCNKDKEKINKCFSQLNSFACDFPGTLLPFVSKPELSEPVLDHRCHGPKIQVGPA